MTASPLRALAPAVAIRTTGLIALAVTAWGLSAAVDSPDANIGLGILLLGALVLTVATWAAIDGVRSVRQGRPDREGVLVWVVSAAAFGVLTAVGTELAVAVSGGADDGVPIGVLVNASLTYAGLIAAPAAVAFALLRNAAEAQARRRRGEG
jgi:hypothetical protein